MKITVIDEKTFPISDEEQTNDEHQSNYGDIVDNERQILLPSPSSEQPLSSRLMPASSENSATERQSDYISTKVNNILTELVNHYRQPIHYESSSLVSLVTEDEERQPLSPTLQHWHNQLLTLDHSLPYQRKGDQNLAAVDVEEASATSTKTISTIESWSTILPPLICGYVQVMRNSLFKQISGIQSFPMVIYRTGVPVLQNYALLLDAMFSSDKCIQSTLDIEDMSSRFQTYLSSDSVGRTDQEKLEYDNINKLNSPFTNKDAMIKAIHVLIHDIMIMTAEIRFNDDAIEEAEDDVKQKPNDDIKRENNNRRIQNNVIIPSLLRILCYGLQSFVACFRKNNSSSSTHDNEEEGIEDIFIRIAVLNLSFGSQRIDPRNIIPTIIPNELCHVVTEHCSFLPPPASSLSADVTKIVLDEEKTTNWGNICFPYNHTNDRISDNDNDIISRTSKYLWEILDRCCCLLNQSEEQENKKGIDQHRLKYKEKTKHEHNNCLWWESKNITERVCTKLGMEKMSHVIREFFFDCHRLDDESVPALRQNQQQRKSQTQSLSHSVGPYRSFPLGKPSKAKSETNTEKDSFIHIQSKIYIVIKFVYLLQATSKDILFKLLPICYALIDCPKSRASHVSMGCTIMLKFLLLLEHNSANLSSFHKGTPTSDSRNHEVVSSIIEEFYDGIVSVINLACRTNRDGQSIVMVCILQSYLFKVIGIVAPPPSISKATATLQQRCLKDRRNATKQLFNIIHRNNYNKENDDKNGGFILCVLQAGIIPLLNQHAENESIVQADALEIGRLGLVTLLPLLEWDKDDYYYRFSSSQSDGGQQHLHHNKVVVLGQRMQILTMIALINLMMSAYPLMKHHGGKLMCALLATLGHAKQNLTICEKSLEKPSTKTGLTDTYDKGNANCYNHLLSTCQDTYAIALHASAVCLVICGARSASILDDITDNSIDNKQVKYNPTLVMQCHEIRKHASYFIQCEVPEEK